MHPLYSFDPFTFDIIQQAIAATADEMFAVMRKTAMSPIIYEVLDFGAGVTDSDGNLLRAQEFPGSSARSTRRSNA